MKRQYQSYAKTLERLEDVAARFPHLIQLQSIGKTWEDREIMLATVCLDLAHADEKPALLYTGTIHAREWIGNELGLSFIDHLTENCFKDPELENTLSHNCLYIVPCLNPDGFEYSRKHFSFWRKNRRNNGDGTFGVDLNRNFGVRFKRGHDTSLNTYSGPEAFSEPETRAIRDFVLSHQNITIALDYHSQGNVFFPAHKFNHESEIEGTDLNVLCANMNKAIFNVTGRRYGIHRGKPPANLIHGSGREYYYSLGILAAVVEVGTRNIPDYLVNMSQSVDENINALRYALSEARNYSGYAPPRVENFTIENIDVYEATLSWEYDDDFDDIAFEIYRSDKVKGACDSENRIAITRDRIFTDQQLRSGHKYYYNIRAVQLSTQAKSPYAPEIKLKTQLANDEYFRSVFPNKLDIGYVGEFTKDKNKEHFGNNSLFVGINKKRGICYGVIVFNLENLPDNARIKHAEFSLYPMNRVNAKVENFGEWTVSILDGCEITDFTDFEQIHAAMPIQTLGQEIQSDKLTQGIWSHWQMNVAERHLIRRSIRNGKLMLRVEGPRKLPIGEDSQMMQFDIGFGKFGAGIHYRPNLELIYTHPSEQVTLLPKATNTISKSEITENQLMSGYDEDGDFVFGQMEFNAENLPDPDRTIITEAYLELQNKNALNCAQDVRFTIELVNLKETNYPSVKEREKIEYIGYEVSNAQLKERDHHHFIFDSFCRSKLEELYTNSQPFHFLVRATSSYIQENALVDWHHKDSEHACKLIIKYLQRRKVALPAVSDVKIKLEKNRVKLTWKNPEHRDLVGVFVVRNCFHPPKSPLDGVKLYAGKDEYTYDKYANPNIPKYYSIFTYDDVPHYSQPASIFYSSDKVFLVEEEEYEMQEEEKEPMNGETNHSV